MKLAFCLFKYFPYGGLQRDFYSIASKCYARGHEIHVYTMQWKGSPPPEDWIIHEIPVPNKQNHTRNFIFANRLRNELNNNPPDLVIGFNKIPWLDIYYAGDVCYRARARELHGFLYRLLPRYRQLIALEKAIFQPGRSTEILLMTETQRSIFQKHYGTENERLHLLPPGIAQDRKPPANADKKRNTLRKQYGLSCDDILLLMIGSGFKTKGLDRTLYAFAELPEATRSRSQLFVIGEDNPGIFKKLAAKLKIEDRLNFLGGRADVPDFLLAADLLIHPAYHENAGMVLLEAMIAGLPVLTTDVCGYAHYIREANAGIVLASPFQQQEMNMTLQKMLSSKSYPVWKQNGLTFGVNADIYHLPERAVEIIEDIGNQRVSG